MARRTCLAVALAFLAVLVAAESAPAQQPKRGGVLRIADREAPNLDPHLNISFLTHSWANMVYSQLVRYPHGPEQHAPRVKGFMYHDGFSLGYRLMFTWLDR